MSQSRYRTEKNDLTELRTLFGEVISAISSATCQLDKNSKIILHPNFENRTVKLLRGKLNSLSVSELEGIDVLLKIRVNSEANDASVSFVSCALMKRSTEMEKNLDARFLRPTLTVCERLFNNPGSALSHRPLKTDPGDVETQIFLHINKCSWNVNDVVQIFK